MYRVLDCIRYEHDYRLVLLAVAICALTSWMAWYLYAMSSKSRGLSRWAWILQTAVATGSGIWATHFIAMLAFKSSIAHHLRALTHTDVVANRDLCERSRVLHCRRQQIHVDLHFSRCCGGAGYRNDALRGDASDEHLRAYSLGSKFGHCLYRQAGIV